jgi:C1A family cysteine protease
MPKKRIVRPLNLKRQKKDKRDYILSAVRVKLPKVVDHSDLMSPVKDQLRLGSCVGFAAVALKEWHENKESLFEKKGKKDKNDFSEQWVYYQCKAIDAWPDEEGTDIRSAMKVLHKKGVPVEAGWPYNDVEVGKPRKWAAMVGLWNVIAGYESINSMKELRLSLHVNGPVVAGIACAESIFDPVDGVIPMPPSDRSLIGGHAICLVGYDDDKQLIKFKNSWGRNWGKKGYGFLSYEYANMYMFDVWAATDIAVKKLAPYT